MKDEQGEIPMKGLNNEQNSGGDSLREIISWAMNSEMHLPPVGGVSGVEKADPIMSPEEEEALRGFTASLVSKKAM